MKIIGSENINEILASFIIFQSILLKPIILYTGLNTYLLLFTSLMAILIVLIREKRFKLRLFNSLLIILSYVLVEFLFRGNLLSQYYIYNWLIYALIPLIVISEVKNYITFLNWCYKFAIAALIIYMFDPMNGYKLSEDYMGFGYNIMLPIYLISIIKSLSPQNSLRPKVLNYFMIIIPAVLMIIFANRGTILCIIFSLLIKMLFYMSKKNLIMKMTIVNLTALIGAAIYLNYIKIIEFMYNLCINNNYYSYSLSSLYWSLKTNNGVDLGGRNDIIKNALDIFKDNVLIGKGMGYFESIYGKGSYPHNLFADILSTAGILGALVFVLAIICSVRTFVRASYGKKLVMLFFLLLFFPKLLLSSTFMRDTGFWIFIMFWAL